MAHYSDVIVVTMASKITSLTIVYSTFIQAQIKKHIKAPRHWPLCGEITGTGEFPAQMASNADNVSIWRRHHGLRCSFAASYKEPQTMVRFYIEKIKTHRKLCHNPYLAICMIKPKSSIGICTLYFAHYINLKTVYIITTIIELPNYTVAIKHIKIINHWCLYYIFAQF